MAHNLIDQLLSQTGLHVGTTRDTREDAAPQAARIMVRPLPGGSGVAFDYEGLNILADEERPLGHSEHSVLARRSDGLALYCAHMHAPVLAELRETEPGNFDAVDGSSPFPLSIRIEVPAPRRLLYTWSFSDPSGDLQTRIVGDVALVD